MLRSSKSLIILCIKHTSIVITKNLQWPSNEVHNVKSYHKIHQSNSMSSGNKTKMDYACIVEKTTRVCFLLFQDIAPPVIIKMYLEVDFLSSKHPPRSEYVYPTTFKLSTLLYTSIYFLVFYKYLITFLAAIQRSFLGFN